MSVEAIEAYIENGQVRLPPDLHLPEHTKVYIVVPEGAPERSMAFEELVLSRRKVGVRIDSPRLANSEDSKHFQMKLISSLDSQKS